MDKICVVIVILALIQELAFCWPLRFYPLQFYQNGDNVGEPSDQIIQSSPPLTWEDISRGIGQSNRYPVPLPPSPGYYYSSVVSPLQSYQLLPHFPTSDDLFSVFVPDVQSVPENLQQNPISHDVTSEDYIKPGSSNVVIPSSLGLVFPSATVETSTQSDDAISFTRKSIKENFSTVIDSVRVTEWDTNNDPTNKETSSQSNTRRNTVSDVVAKSSSDLVSRSVTVKTSTRSNDLGFTRKSTNNSFSPVTDSVRVIEWDTNNDQRNNETLRSSRYETTGVELFTLSIPETSSISSPTTLQIDEDLRRLGNAEGIEMTKYEKSNANSNTEENTEKNQFFSDAQSGTIVKVSDDMTTTSNSTETSTPILGKSLENMSEDLRNLVIDYTERDESDGDFNTASNVTGTDSHSTEIPSKVESDDFRQSTSSVNEDETTQVSEKMTNHTIIESDSLKTIEVGKVTTVSDNKTDFPTNPYFTEAPSKAELDDFRLSTFDDNEAKTTPTQVSEEMINYTITESDNLETTEVDKMTAVVGNGTNFSMNYVEMEQFIATLNSTDETIAEQEESSVDLPMSSDVIDPTLMAVDQSNSTFDVYESSGNGELEQFATDVVTERSFSVGVTTVLINKTEGSSDSTFQAIHKRNELESNATALPSVDINQPGHVIEFGKKESSDSDTVDREEFIFNLRPQVQLHRGADSPSQITIDDSVLIS